LGGLAACRVSDPVGAGQAVVAGGPQAASRRLGHSPWLCRCWGEVEGEVAGAVAGGAGGDDARVLVAA
jgi:hypothetical protein